MSPGNEPRRRAGPSSIAALALAWSLFATGAAQAAVQPDGGILSPRLAELSRPSVRDASPAEQARKLSLAPEGPGSLLRDGNRVLVYVRFEHGAAASVESIRDAGAKIVNVSGRYETVTVAAKPDQLQALADVPGAIGAKEVLAPVVSGAPPGSSAAPPTTPCFGAATSEGDQQLRAAEARQAFGVDGAGVTVGILSDSFDSSKSAAATASDDVKSGDLPGPGNPCGFPTPVRVLEEIEDPEDGEDEGRAMAQVVHDLAPGARLAFATAFNGEEAFAENIERLARPVAEGGAEAKVIADDVFYLDEPFFQDGPVAAAADRVHEEGAVLFSAAGNDNLIEEPEPGVENDIASWEAPEFRDGGGCPSGTPSYAAHCLDFDPSNVVDDTGFSIRVEPEETLTIDLQWAQPWHEVKTDLDAYLLRNEVEVAEAEEPNTHTGSQEPVEILSWTNPSSSSRAVTLAIDRCNLACGTARAAAHPELAGTSGGNSGTPRLKFALLENGGGVSSTEYPVSSGGDTVGPTIFGHSGSAGEASVGAVPFFSDARPEDYSSRGPVTHYFGPVEGPGAAAALESPETLAKPNVVATDGGANTFFGACVGHVWRFFGTSAATPHAAAVAALELSADPSASASEAIEAQTETATPVGSFPPEAVGGGLVDAVGALERLLGESPAVEPVGGPEFAPPDCSPSPEGSTLPLQEAEEKIAAANPPAPATPAPTAKSRKAPDTFLRKRPHAEVFAVGRSAKVVFRFGASEQGVDFLCKIDDGAFQACPARFVHRFPVGRHVLRAKARDSAGLVDPTPVVFRFRIERVGQDLTTR
jgi:hypothetical protein